MNNPLIYTDPDGEWIHLLVGAFIGGTMNFIMNVHKIENIGQGLAYFGVGAAAGALGAGVGAGISSAKAGGSFGAGFIGSSAAMTATSSFITGAAIGGGAGLAGGFTTGFGNGLLGGQSFGESLWSGTKSGLIGGLSGAALGGLLGGIDAARDGRRFWDGATVQKTVLVEQPIPAVPQRGDMNCVPANVEAIDRSFGGDITQKEMRDILGGEADNDMLLDGNIWDAYRDYRAPQYYIHQSDMTGNARLGEVLNNMQAGQRVSINTTVNGGHSVVMQKVVQQTVTKINGTVSQKLLYYVMNPNGGVFQRISAGTIENAHNIFYIFPR
jgi:hypothetical protein